MGQISKICQLLILEQVDASKFRVLTNSTLEYVSKANKRKEMCIPINESQIKSCRVLINMSCRVLSVIKGQRVAHIAQMTCFEYIVRICGLIHPNFFFHSTCS